MEQKRVATLILNRNLPAVTDELYAHLRRWDGDVTDIYVVESGSQKEKLSRHCSFWADWPDALERGLRWARGFNYGLLELDKTGKRYEFYFLVMGDSEFYNQPTIAPMVELMDKYQRLGILSPLSTDWGEDRFVPDSEDLRTLWDITHVSWLFRRTLIDELLTKDAPTYMNYLYDGENFRGYYCDIELIVKGYQRGYASAITSRAKFREKMDLTKNNAKEMKTDEQVVHWRLMLEEGLEWMKKKYGFTDKSEFKKFAQREYEKFIQQYPEYQEPNLAEKTRVS